MKSYLSISLAIAFLLGMGNAYAQPAPKPVTEDRYQANIDALERTQALLLGKPVSSPALVTPVAPTPKPEPKTVSTTSVAQPNEEAVKPVPVAPKPTPQIVKQINNPVEKTILLQPENEVKSKDAIPAWQVQLN